VEGDAVGVEGDAVGVEGDAYLSPPQVWSPEKVDELLSRRVQQMRKQGTMLYERKRFIFEQLMGG